MTSQSNPQGIGYQDQTYSQPTGGNPVAPLPPANQVAVSFNGNKWTWLPTRVRNRGGEPRIEQYPDHYGLDVFLVANDSITEDVKMYSVYQTVYLALKEQD